jgi:hypothetical protein
MDLSSQLRPSFTAKALGVLDGAAGMGSWDRPMGTLDVFLTLMRVDAAADWQRIWLSFSEPDASAAGRYHDSSPSAGDSWNGRPVTGTCARAIRAAVALADRSAPDLLPVPAGLLALCLVGEPTTAASRALGATSEPARSMLLELVQETLVNGHWDDIESVLEDCFDPTGPGAPGSADNEDPDVRAFVAYQAGQIQALMDALNEFLRAGTPDRSGALLEQHPELLSAPFDAIIAKSITEAEQARDHAGARQLRERRLFLENYRQLIDQPLPATAPAGRAGECDRSDHALTGSIVNEPGYTSIAVRCGRCHVGYLTDVWWKPSGEARVDYYVFPADGAATITPEILTWAIAACEQSITELEQMGGRVQRSTPTIGMRPESLRRHTDFTPV